MPEETLESSACMDQHIANPHTVRLQHSQSPAADPFTRSRASRRNAQFYMLNG
jgi:hypothetical protein